MSFSLDYELLDFGKGRKLERFGSLRLDRLSPAADGSSFRSPELWSQAQLRYSRRGGTKGRWESDQSLPESWTISAGELRFQLKLNSFGHVGLFPEQQANWQWIVEQVQRAAEQLGRPPKVLNLFAYTGASSLAAAWAGAEVVHVDAAKNVVNWARENARLSGLEAAPIRWIAEDARRFAEREARRENAYDAIILDPPSYGHGPKGQVWQIDEHLPELLTTCSRICPTAEFLLLSCHSPNWSAPELAASLARGWSHRSEHQLVAGEMELPDRTGRRLPCGAVVRWHR